MWIDLEGRYIRPPDVSLELAGEIMKQPQHMSTREIASQCKCSTAEVRAVWDEFLKWREKLKG
jgi:hypothetical protein